MTFNSNRAWNEAAMLVSANRDLLIAIAGVFFLLPSLLFGLFLPQPQMTPGTSPEKMMPVIANYYGAAFPFILVMVLLQALGTMAMLTLFTDSSRPTVKESLRQGLVGMLPYVLAQLLFAVAFALAGGIAGGLAAMSGSLVVLLVLLAALIVLAIWVYVRISLVAPVIAVDRVRSPIVALQRSWQLTRGQSLRIAVFYVLIFLVIAVVMSIVTGVLGLLLALVAPPAMAQLIVSAIASVLSAAAAVYLVAINASIHRQLAGPSPAAEARPFE